RRHLHDRRGASMEYPGGRSVPAPTKSIRKRQLSRHEDPANSPRLGNWKAGCSMTSTGADSFSALMEQLRSGDDDAARAIFARFPRRLVTLARRRFDRRLSCRVDPEDVVQSAFKSFFIRQREG